MSPDSINDGTWSQQLQGIIKRRRMSVYMIIGAFLILLVIYNVGNFIFLRQMARQLEAELEKRLLSIVTLSATIVENEFLESFQPTLENEFTLLTIRRNLNSIRMQNGLEALYIIDRNYQTMLDSRQEFEHTITRTYLQEDSVWIEKAWRGVSASGPLHHFKDQRFKSAYAPVRNLSGEQIGVIAAEANAYFFTTLERYRNTFFVTALISGGVFILFTAFLIYALRLLSRTHENLRNTERLAMMGQMSAVLAHEIRNPLGIIRGAADVLRSKYQKDQSKDPMFEYIPDEVQRLNKLVDHFLLLSRETKLNFTRQDINHLLQSTIEKMTLEQTDDSIQFRFDRGEIPPFYFDADAIQQVVINLMKNAVQAIDSKGQIIVATSRQKIKRRPFVRITFSDNGQGIEEDLNRIFEPFYTTKSTGSGLGMAVSKKIIESHAGTIHIDSTKGKGTTVTVYLPLKKDPAKEV